MDRHVLDGDFFQPFDDDDDVDLDDELLAEPMSEAELLASEDEEEGGLNGAQAEVGDGPGAAKAQSSQSQA